MYVKVMACSGECTNGGGQAKLTETEELRALEQKRESVLIQEGDVVAPGPNEQRECLAKNGRALYIASDVGSGLAI